MKILHLETSSKNCSVAISDGQQLLSLCEEVSENYKQAENLHVFIKWALEGSDIQLKDLSAVALGNGPGSYTGLRIGASSAKGICYTLGIPLLAVSSLTALAQPLVGQDYDQIIPLVDARRMEVYTAVFDGTSGALLQPAKNLILDEKAFAELQGKNIAFVGDGAAKAKEVIKVNAEYITDAYPSAKSLIPSAYEAFINNQFQDVAYFEPFYLKEFHGTKPRTG